MLRLPHVLAVSKVALVGIHIPSFIKLIEKGEMLEAVGIIRETSSLPAVCGRVCPQEKQCESQCIYTLSLKKEAVSIGNLERYVADYERLHRDRSIKPKRSEKPKLGRIAVVGSGPAVYLSLPTWLSGAMM